ncbi:MAG: zinc-dependent metalloprotease [Gammaproteobacteria bacterium]|nr:zinc-dependent metalloprotease [Gammaproteobacteria bacterium]
MNRVLTVIALLSFTMIANAQSESTIRILSLATATANVADGQKESFQVVNTWNKSGIPAGPLGSTTISSIWLGIPLPLADMSGTGDLQSQFAEAYASVALAEMRNFYGADVVIVYTGNFGTNPNGSASCGGASAGNWAGNPPVGFTDPDQDGLDLSGSEDAFIAIVGTTGPCKSYTDFYSAAHEFGHLLGAGHYDPRIDSSGAPNGMWLYSDSRAYVHTWWESWPTYAVQSRKTVMASGAPSKCVIETPSTPGCTYWENRFSQKPPPSNIGSDEKRTSTANHRPLGG